MKLWLVTYDLDLTQFLVDATSKEKAIQEADRHNHDIGEFDDGSEISLNDYSVEEVDFETLDGLFHREDMMYRYGNSIAFRD